MNTAARWSALALLALLLAALPQRSNAQIFPPMRPVNRNLEVVSSIPVAGGVFARYGSHLYVPNRQEIAIIDVANPSAPRSVGSYRLTERVEQIAVEGNFAYVIGVQVKENNIYDDTFLRVLDLSAPQTPKSVASVRISPFSGSSKLVVSGSVALVSVIEVIGVLGYGGNSYVVDIARPRAPRVAAQIGGTFNDGLIDGVYASLVSGGGSISDLNSRLRVFDLSDLANPVQVSRIQLGSFSDSVAKNGTNLYVAERNAYTVFDVGQPSAPASRGVWTQPLTGRLTAQDGTLFLWGGVDDQGFVHLFDPRGPTETAFHNLPFPVVDFEANGTTLYALGSSYMTNQRALTILRYVGQSAVSGRVLDRRGQPLANAVVTNTWGQTVSSDASGNYSFATVPPGTGVFTATLAGYTFSDKQTLAVPHEGTELWFVGLPAPVQTPVAVGSSARLTLREPQGMETTVDVPSGAIAAGATLALTPTLARDGGGLAAVGYAFDLGALAVSGPLTITLRYAEGDVRPVTDEGALLLRRWDGAAWQDAAQSCATPGAYQRDLAANTLAVAVCSGGRFSLVGPTRQMHLPVVVRGRAGV